LTEITGDFLRVKRKLCCTGEQQLFKPGQDLWRGAVLVKAAKCG